MLSVRRCSCADVMENPAFPALADEYAEECRIAGLPWPDGKLQTYQYIERSGTFQPLGAFIDDSVVGFAAILAPVIPHYGVTIAVTESLFVGKAFRKTGAGLLLLRAAEAYAREVGSPGMLISAPSGGILDRLLTVRKGFRETNRAYFKEFSHA